MPRTNGAVEVLVRGTAAIAERRERMTRALSRRRRDNSGDRCSKHDTILRFVTTERLLHWAIAIPFLGCFVSAVVLVLVYNPVLVAHNPDPTRAYRHLFAWMHRACGAGLFLCPSLVLLSSLRHWHIHLYNIRQGWIWTLDDIKWLVLMGPATFSKRIVLPDQGKFNAAEKLNFMMVMVFPPLLVASGILIWFPDATKLGSFSPWIAHCALVGLATPLVLGHMFMATINPGTRVGLNGMLNGFVSREWAAHHYARWFREQFPNLAQEHAHEPSHNAEATAPASTRTEFRPQPTTVGPDFFQTIQRLPGLDTVATAVAEIDVPISAALDDSEDGALRASDDTPVVPDALCEVDCQIE